MKRLLLALGFALALCAGAQAQQPTGTECWPVTPGTGAVGQNLCINQVRNGQALTVVSGSGAATTIASRDQSMLMWTSTAPTTWTVTLPNPAFDGEIFEVSTDTTLTTLVTVQAASAPQNQTMSATFSGQTLTAATSAEWRFSLGSLKWFRAR